MKIAQRVCRTHDSNYLKTDLKQNILLYYSFIKSGFFVTFLKGENRELWVLAWPIIIAQLGQVLFGIVDTLMVSTLGTADLAASAFANSVFWFGSIIAIGVCNVTAPLVATAIGERNEAKAGQILFRSRNLSVLLGLVLTVILIGLGLNFQIFKQDATVSKLAVPYFFVLITSVIPMLVFQSYRQFLEATGHQKEPMYLTFAGVGLNVILNYLFIFGAFGFPEMGLLGAGVATSVTRWMMALGAIYACHSKADLNKYLLHKYSDVAVKYIEMLKLGLPVGMILFFEVGAFGMATILAGQINKESLAAHQIVLNIASFTFMVPLGLSFAASVRVGLAVGEKRFDLVKKRAIVSFAFGIGFMATMSVVILLLRGVLAKALSSDPQVIELAMALFLLAALFQIVDGIQVVANGVLRALKDVRIPMIATFFGYWVVSLPLGYYLVNFAGFDVKGLWIGLAAGLLVVAILMVLRFFWLHKQITTRNRLEA